MLAGLCRDVNDIQFPVLCTPKIDGIRCVTLDQDFIDPKNPNKVQVLTRNLKPIPNNYIRQVLGDLGLPNLDGELIVGETFQNASSAIMSEDGQPNFIFYVFDIIAPGLTHFERVQQLIELKLDAHPHIRPLYPVVIKTVAELLSYERACLEMKFEGVMIRSFEGPYKFGRSTEKQAWLLKLKRFTDEEAVCVGYEELFRNLNESTTNALGLAERSDHSANKVPAGILGALRVRRSDGVEFNVGSGFTDLQRQTYWAERESLVGRIVKYKFQNHGIKIAPRHPVFLGFRDIRDCSVEPISDGALY